jgi:cyclopropane fatty-acyl-phospholipid synthase-like methyltransferase
MAAIQFNLLTFLGLRESNTLLDIGCGSLRAGRLFIPYLSKGKYYGVEPQKWLVEEGIKNEIGKDLVGLKQPKFLYVEDWSFEKFNTLFDFILAQSIFSHAPRREIELCLSKARKRMHGQTIFAATLFIAEKNYTGLEWKYPEKVSYSKETINNMVLEAGLISQQINWPHPSQTWFLISRPENSSKLANHSMRINEIFSTRTENLS